MIKARIADELGMPTGKQKLQVGVSIYFFLTVCIHGYIDVSCDTPCAALQPGRINPHIRVKWVTFSPGQAQIAPGL